MIGFTLIELMVTLSVLVILLTVGVPQLAYLVGHNSRTVEVNTMIGHLNFARAEAIMRASEIVLCPVRRGDPATCTETPWSDGYAVVDPQTGEALRYQKSSHRVAIRPTRNFADGVTFQDDGSVRGAAGGSFHFCTSVGNVEPRRLVVSGVGRTLVSGDANCSGSG